MCNNAYALCLETKPRNPHDYEFLHIKNFVFPYIDPK